MSAKKMSREEEYEFYAKAENQEPQGPARRRRSRLTEMVPVRFPPETLEEVRRRAGDDDRSVSSWIRVAVQHELEKLQQSGEPLVSGSVSAPPTSQRLRAHTGTDERGVEGAADQELRHTGAHERPQAPTGRRRRPTAS